MGGTADRTKSNILLLLKRFARRRVATSPVRESYLCTSREPARGLCLLIAGSISCEDVKGSETVIVGGWRDRSLDHPQWAIMASANKSSPLENVRDETPGSTATVAWPSQACPLQFDLPLVRLAVMIVQV